MVGFEVDARTADSPANTEVIARIELPDMDNGGVLRAAEMVFHERPGGGAVFAGGSVNYVQGIVRYYNPRMALEGQADAVAREVTNNVLRRLSSTGSGAAPVPIKTRISVAYSQGEPFLEVMAPMPGIVQVEDVRGHRVVKPVQVGEGSTTFALGPQA